MLTGWSAALLSAAVIAPLANAQCEAWIPSPPQSPAALNGTVSATTTWDPDGPGPLAPRLVLGGSFTVPQLAGVYHIAAWDGTLLTPLGSGLTPAVSSLCAHAGHLFASTQPASAGVFRFDPSGWTSLGTVQGSVNTLFAYSNDLWAGGVFTRVDGVDVDHLAHLSGGVWTNPGVTLSGGVNTACTFQNDLVIAGSFAGLSAGAGLQIYNRVARWDGQQWRTMGSGFNGWVRALTVHEGALIAAGDFTASGTTACNAIARWDGTAWQPLGPGFESGVRALASYQGQLIAGGTFRHLAGAPSNGPVYDHIARWDGTAWHPMGFGLDSDCLTLTEYQGDLVAGGSFTRADRTPSQGWARWRRESCCGPADFDGDGTPATEADITAFFACLGGHCCPTCSSADFNHDGDTGTDQDIEAFFRVLGGSSC